MTRTLTTLVVLASLLTAPASLLAADEPKPGQIISVTEPEKLGTLPTQEAADGWIQLFDGQTPFGWTIKGPSKITDGALVLGGSGETLAQTNSEFGCFDLTFRYNAPNKSASLVLDGQRIELPTGDKKAWNQAAIHVAMHGEDRIITVAFPVADKPISGRDVATGKGPGRTAIVFEAPDRGQLALRDVKLKPLNMKSLFNGKNLTGWAPVPGHPSKFSVTDKGELNIKEGNGEIKTEDQWADFVLQLDVFSNGKHLNSGVFFRDLPGPDEFWQGYEAQIRNEWDGYSNNEEVNKRKEDRAKPFDMGTGGIYTRQPSRKVVSNDKEWFTYTILANGNHIATWVNGYQTADYFDKDKDAPTARKGRFLGKGCIGLQGHDPTTDLSFRNIRLEGLPPKK